MRASLVTLLIGLLLAASSATPVCEIDCSIGQNADAPVGTFTGSTPGHCHESAGETGSPSEPSQQHPCKRVHHPGEMGTVLRAAPARELSQTIGSDCTLSPGIPRMSGEMLSPILGARSNWGESLFLPLNRLALFILLRI